ncbi:MAG TPA: coenzyme F420-0:L-glutamate ligase [Pseudomonadales bacterium]|nr:coenzyme F420-0:L-glutamate ligase [Pseudomonadales bacterium]
MPSLTITPLAGMPMVRAGDDLAALILTALAAQKLALEAGDILVVAQKIVSKSEGRQVALASITPSPEAVQLANETEKDPRLVELILRESTTVLRKKPGVLIVRQKLGLVGAQAGIDQSNIEHGADENALLLPEDPDRSARQIRDTIAKRTGVRPGVIVSDSMNRPWRLGTIGGAIGSAGIQVLDDRRGMHDIYGREMKVTMINRADSIATAATLVMGETTERTPVALVRGFAQEDHTQTARDIIRPLEEDMFR